MKYPELKYLCKYCVVDCARLEDINFTGTIRCNAFEPKEKDWYEKYRKELKNEQVFNQKR